MSVFSMEEAGGVLAPRALVDEHFQDTPAELLNLLPAAAYMCDRNGTILRFNRKAAELWGREPKIGDQSERFCGSYRMYRPDGRRLPHAECPMAEALRTGIDMRDLEVVIERPNGERGVALVNINALKDSAGNVIGALNCFHDITGFKKELRTAREELEDFFENAVVPMHLVSGDGMILRANQAELDLLGYARDEYVGRHIAEFHASEATIEHILASLSLGETLNKYPAKLRAKDGSIRHVLVNSSANFENGKFVNTRCVSIDVTELELAQETATETEWRSSGLLAALPAAIYTTDAAGRITFYNEAAVEMWGCAPELGKSEFCGSWKLYWPDGTPLPHDQCPMAIALKEDRSVRGVEAICERPDGSRVPFIPYPTPLHDASGKLVGAINMLIDISDRKKDEEARNRLAAIIEFSDDAIISKNLDGIITSWNTGAERLFGYMAEEVVGKPVTILIPPDRADEEPMILERIRRGELVDHYRTVRRRKDGGLIDISVTVSPLKDAKGRIIGASKIARDISERKRAEERVLLLAREVDHRANNLLAVIQAALQLTNADTAEGMKAAMAGRIRALGHANKLLSESRWAGADLRKLIEEELAPYRKEQDRIEIDGVSRVLKPDVAQSLALAAHELATNAAKYGALSNASGRIRIEWTDHDDRVVIRWSEHGGPAVAQPTKKGFGTGVIERMLRGHLSGDIRFDWRKQGLVCEITVPANTLA